MLNRCIDGFFLNSSIDSSRDHRDIPEDCDPNLTWRNKHVSQHWGERCEGEETVVSVHTVEADLVNLWRHTTTYSQEVGEQQVSDAELSVSIRESPACALEADLVVPVRRRMRTADGGRGGGSADLAPRSHHRVQLFPQRPHWFFALIHLS